MTHRCFYERVISLWREGLGRLMGVDRGLRSSVVVGMTLSKGENCGTLTHSEMASRERFMGPMLVALTFVFVAPLRSADDFKRSYGRIRAISQTVSDEIPLVVAEGGASGYVAGNTRDAVVMAHAFGADYIQVNVALSGDGVPVVIPSFGLDACTNVREIFTDRFASGNVACCNYTLKELRQLQLVALPSGNQQTARNYASFQIATLPELMELIQTLNESRNRKTGLYLTICEPEKHRTAGLDVSREVIEVLQKHGYTKPEDRVFVVCDDSEEVLRLRTEFDCRLPLFQSLDHAPEPEQISEISKVADGIMLPVNAVAKVSSGAVTSSSAVAVVAHGHALMIHIRGIRLADLEAAEVSVSVLLNELTKNAGVDGILCDCPDAALIWRRASNAEGPRRGPFHLLHGRPPKSSR